MGRLEIFVQYLSDIHGIVLTEEQIEDEVTVDNNDYFYFENIEVLILNNEERYEKVKDGLMETISYFNSDFLATMTDLPEDVFEALIDKNEAVYKLVEKTCGIDEFIEEAVFVDGWGHFLNGYDGTEEEYDDYYVYRQN